jgi:hypothetical protein
MIKRYAFPYPNLSPIAYGFPPSRHHIQTLCQDSHTIPCKADEMSSRNPVPSIFILSPFATAIGNLLPDVFKADFEIGFVQWCSPPVFTEFCHTFHYQVHPFLEACSVAATQEILEMAEEVDPIRHIQHTFTVYRIPYSVQLRETGEHRSLTWRISSQGVALKAFLMD